MTASSHPPSVDALARLLRDDSRLAMLPRPLLVDAARAGVAESPTDALAAATRHAITAQRRLLVPVINATGTLLHTNLGRAPRPSMGGHPSAVRGVNVELDLATGSRGSRHAGPASLIRRLTGCDDALVVNNCAAGLVLALGALAKGRGVVVSRGELVEIGGGFRIPEIIEQSGCTLVEVGTTNRTRLADYQRAIDTHDVAVVLKVHPSNYRISGFTEEVDVDELATLGLPVVADLGTGLLDASTPWLADASGAQPDVGWIRSEPSVRGWLTAGADVVIVSGDKVLGGPQAGIVAGSSPVIAACAKHPLMRALRPGALVMEALQHTLLAYAGGTARTLPFWEQATRTVPSLRARAERIVEACGDGRVTVGDCSSTPGGGTMPDTAIASAGLRIEGQFADALRHCDVPIIARTMDAATWLDLRTVDPEDDARLTSSIVAALGLRV